MKPSKNEVEIKGQWEAHGTNALPDENCKRIEWLKSKYFKKVTSDETGWDTLYLDPEDGRYWELTYPNSEMQGGGPPVLKIISSEDIPAKYHI